MMTKILVVDDDDFVLSALTRTLRKYDWQIDTYNDPVKALEATSKQRWDLIISDFKMPQMDGISFLERAHLNLPDALLMIMSANIDLNGLTEALNRAHVHRFITKPWDDLLLGRVINEAVVHQNLLSENQRLADEVRRQKQVINKQQLELQRLEQDSPGITKVEWDEDGAIVLDDSDF